MCPIYKEPKAGSHDSVRLGVGKMAGQVEASLRFPVVYFSVRAITEMRLTLFCFRAIDLSPRRAIWESGVWGFPRCRWNFSSET
jgi:hypothetical protein